MYKKATKKNISDLRAYVYKSHGLPKSVLAIESLQQEKTPNFFVLQSPINPSDINMIEGKYAILPKQEVKIGGNECIGITEVNGKSRLAMPKWPGVGTWRKQLYLESENMVLLPPGFKHSPALSMLSINPPTAYRMLKDFVKLEKDDLVIQNAANSVVGKCVIQLAKEWGIRTINIVRDREGVEETTEELKKLGATYVVTEKESQNNDELKKLISETGKAKLALNAVGGNSVNFLSRSLENGGIVVTYGGMSKMPVIASTASFIFRNLTFKGFWISEWYNTCDDKTRLKMMKELYKYMEEGKLVFDYDLVKFEDFDKVLQRIENPIKNKKTIIDMM